MLPFTRTRNRKQKQHQKWTRTVNTTELPSRKERKLWTSQYKIISALHLNMLWLYEQNIRLLILYTVYISNLSVSFAVSSNSSSVNSLVCKGNTKQSTLDSVPKFRYSFTVHVFVFLIPVCAVSLFSYSLCSHFSFLNNQTHKSQQFLFFTQI